MPSKIPKNSDGNHSTDDIITPGRFMDAYKIQESQLGHGSYSTVHPAIRISDGMKVAVKVIMKNRLKPSDEASIRSEISIMKSLDHPNIIKMLDFYEDHTKFYIVMELIAGGELFDRLVTKTLYTEAMARELIIIIFKAIKYLHDRNIVHRDLKPENILLLSKDDDISIKIADFGFAVQLKSPTDLIKNQAGTPGYVAPEILERKEHGKPVDMWSMGVIIYMLLGGYPPFYDVDNNQKNLFRKILNCDYQFHHEFWSNISAEAKDLISKLLVINPSQRYTIDQALAHPWIGISAQQLSLISLEKNLMALKDYHNQKLNNVMKFAIEAIKKASKSSFNDVKIDVIRKISGTSMEKIIVQKGTSSNNVNKSS